MSRNWFEDGEVADAFEGDGTRGLLAEDAARVAGIVRRCWASPAGRDLARVIGTSWFVKGALRAARPGLSAGEADSFREREKLSASVERYAAPEEDHEALKTAVRMASYSLSLCARETTGMRPAGGRGVERARALFAAELFRYGTSELAYREVSGLLLDERERPATLAEERIWWRVARQVATGAALSACRERAPDPGGWADYCAAVTEFLVGEGGRQRRR